MAGRSWRWLRTRIFGLLTVPVSMVAVPAEKGAVRVSPVWSTRLQSALNPEPEAVSD